MDWKLEVVVVPVTDVDRARCFYSEQVGFVVDHDTQINDEMRVAQLTPPGSACSIVIDAGIVDMPPGSLKGLQLVVSDIEAARTQLFERGGRSARFSTTRALTWSMAEAGTGTRSSSSATPTATAGWCRSIPNVPPKMKGRKYAQKHQV